MTDSEPELPAASRGAGQQLEASALYELLRRKGKLTRLQMAKALGVLEVDLKQFLKRESGRFLNEDAEGFYSLAPGEAAPAIKDLEEVLGKKKKHRRLVPKTTIQREKGKGQVGYLCIADEFLLDELAKYFAQRGYHTNLSFDVLHIAPKKPKETEHTSPAAVSAPAPLAKYGAADPVRGFDLFVFRYGVVVWWGYDKRQYSIVENEFALPSSRLNSYVIGRYKATLITANFPVWCEFSPVFRTAEEAPTMEPDQHFTEQLQYDHFIVENDSADVKLCISHALAQSAKIDYMEIKVAELTQSCKPLPRELKEKGSVTISERKLLQLRGEALFYRLMLKSGSDLLDEPELFWEVPVLKPFYTVTKECFEISERVETLDAKLDAGNEILGMISDHFNQRHGSRLEWIVIWLVAIEVIIGVLELVLDIKPWTTS